jgi:phage I-like protein
MKLHVLRISNGAGKAHDGELPSRLKILAWGDNQAVAGINPKIGRHTLDAMPGRMRAFNHDRVALDFEHNTVAGTRAYQDSSEPRAVAAYGVPVLVEGDGLYLDDLVYTPHGRSHALDYIDLSPAVHIDERTGEVDFLHSVALTRAGAVDGLSFFSVLEGGGAQVATKGDEMMDWKEFVRAFAGLAEDATDEQLQQGFAARIAELAAQWKEPDETQMNALSTTVSAMQDELVALSSDFVAMRKQHVCEQAAREGKVVPLSAGQIAAMDVETLSAMVGRLQPTVPVDQRTAANVQALSAASAGDDGVLAQVAARCGLDVATVLEAKKAIGN